MTKDNIGYGGTPYDSKAEAVASYEFARLNCIPAKDKLPYTFTDADGTEFLAKPDFYHAGAGLFIEFKAGPLNGKKTKATADRATASKEQFKGSLTPWDWLQCGWNHAKKKQAIVQRTLTPQNFIVVFDKPPTLAEAVDYQKAGLVFTSLSGLPSYLAYARFAKRGLCIPFQLEYQTEVGPITFTVGPCDIQSTVRIG